MTVHSKTAAALDAAKAAGRTGLVAFLPAGYPSVDECVEAVVAAAENGAVAVLAPAVSAGTATAVWRKVGGGGIGDFAIRYGYQRFMPEVMGAVVIVLIVLVQLVQSVGERIAARFDKRAPRNRGR